MERKVNKSQRIDADKVIVIVGIGNGFAHCTAQCKHNKGSVCI